jgi:hypothetical protein
MAITCDLSSCKRAGDRTLSLVNQEGVSTHYCSPMHLILHQLDLLSDGFKKKSSATLLRAYNTACGVVKKLAQIIEKEWKEAA